MNDWEGSLFNAITFHPDNHMLFSSRLRLTERIAPKVTRMIQRAQRRHDRQQRRWERRNDVDE